MAAILLVGYGDIGKQLAMALHVQGHSVTAIKRQPLAEAAPFPVLAIDIRQSANLKSVSTDFDLVLFIVSAGSRQANDYLALYQTGLHNLLQHFSSSICRPKWLMVSSSSVYGQNNGEWVDETSATQPLAASSQYLVAAEKSLWDAMPESCVVRFSGIYGPGRNWLLRRVASGEAIQQHPPYYTNRIHSDDCVAVLLFLIEKCLAGEALASCYLASDNDPAPLWDVMHWIADQYNYPPPKALILPADAAQNKRCSNARLTALGYRFLFTGYREGYLNPAHYTLCKT